MQHTSEALRLEGKRIAFVPTMGFFHEGHLGLIRKAKEIADVCVTSLFVNPTQFAPNEDFNNYPRNTARDMQLAEASGCDYFFNPSCEEMYPHRFSTSISVEGLDSILEGRVRPTHFRGVTTVVVKLFNIVRPHYAIFGQKDFQQVVILKRMVQDLNMNIDIITAPIARDADGLAMSSRNTYLSADERRTALSLSRSLLCAKIAFEDGERNPILLQEIIRRKLDEAGIYKVDYIAVVDAETLETLETTIERQYAVIALAVRIGRTRLIDNMILKDSD